MAAVKQNGLALEFASQELKKNKDIVKAALQEEKGAKSFVDNSILDDPEIAELL